LKAIRADSYKTFYGRNLRMFVIKLDRLYLASHYSHVSYLWVRSGAFLRVEHLQDVAFKLAPVLANITLGYKGLCGTDTLTYYGHS
jgi:hypothetical protein